MTDDDVLTCCICGQYKGTILHWYGMHVCQECVHKALKMYEAVCKAWGSVPK